MRDFAEEHPIIIGVIAFIMILLLIFCMRFVPNLLFKGNMQVVDTNLAFHYAIIEMGNGELLEGPIRAWHDYNNSDVVQIIMDDGLVILTHYAKVMLFSECP